MDGFVALYLFMLTGIAGYALIANVPSVLHTPLLSGSNFIHGIVLVGAMIALGHAEGPLQLTIGFLSVLAATANAVGGYVVTDRMLAMFEKSAKRKEERAMRAQLIRSGKMPAESQTSDLPNESSQPDAFGSKAASDNDHAEDLRAGSNKNNTHSNSDDSAS